MSKDEDDIAMRVDPSPSDAKNPKDASTEAERSQMKEEELEEGLEESMSDSDAPASTRRSKTE